MCNNECSLLLDRYLKSQVEAAAASIQHLWRTFSRHRKLIAVLVLQRNMRGSIGRRKVNGMKEANAKFKACLVVVSTLKKWRRFRRYRAASLIQSLVRGTVTCICMCGSNKMDIEHIFSLSLCCFTLNICIYICVCVKCVCIVLYHFSLNSKY
jgi:hypothetical protein